jgi:glycine oxidase
MREAYRVLPDVAECEFEGAVAGLRPASADGAPYVGETEIPGLHLACGHFRNGILLAPLSAEATVAGLAGREPPAAAAPFALRGRARGEAIAP